MILQFLWDFYKTTAIVILGPIGIISLIYWNWYFMIKKYKEYKTEGYI